MTITYLRAGRKLRSSGRVMARDGAMTKVMPAHPCWQPVWVTAKEIENGSEKPPTRPRKPPTGDCKRKRVRKPKTPRWRELVTILRSAPVDIGFNPALLNEIADELENLKRLFE
ncbi:MAG: hypothetical protein WCS43_11850 [Verrucomicrobiota bacterium]